MGLKCECIIIRAAVLKPPSRKVKMLAWLHLCLIYRRPRLKRRRH